MGEEERLNAYMGMAQAAYETAFGEAQDLSGWEVIKTASSFVAAKKTMPGGLAALKVDAYIPKQPSDVVSRLYGHFAEFSQELIPDMFESETCAKEFNSTAKVVHSCTKQPAPGVSARDAVYFGVLLEMEEQTYALIETSVNAPEVPLKENYVRSEIRYALHSFERMDDDPSKTHLLMLALIDPKGSLPASLVNLTLGRRADFYERLISKVSS